MALKLKKSFIDDFENVFIPLGKRVTSVEVFNDNGQEFLTIKTENVPLQGPEIIATVNVER